MATNKKFEDLDIWQLARTISRNINQLTQKGLFKKDFSLVDQMKRSSGSAMDNIAEGFERDNNKEFSYFLNVAKGSTGECRSQLYRALDCGYITTEEFEQNYNECMSLSKQIRGFSDYLKNTEIKGHKFK